jgi:hypothetical protein
VEASFQNTTDPFVIISVNLRWIFVALKSGVHGIEKAMLLLLKFAAALSTWGMAPQRTFYSRKLGDSINNVDFP